MGRAKKKNLSAPRGLIPHSLSSPVRVLTERVGELANFSDSLKQKRSCAAILAKKYAESHQKLRNVYNAMQGRELTEAECDAVFFILKGIKNERSEPFELGRESTREPGTLGLVGAHPEPESDGPDLEDDERDPGDSDGLVRSEEDDSCL